MWVCAAAYELCIAGLRLAGKSSQSPTRRYKKWTSDGNQGDERI